MAKEAVENQLQPKPQTVFLQTIDNQVEELETKPIAWEDAWVKLRVAGEDDKTRWVHSGAWMQAEHGQRTYSEGRDR
jgi:hypothetical protein